MAAAGQAQGSWSKTASVRALSIPPARQLMLALRGISDTMPRLPQCKKVLPGVVDLVPNQGDDHPGRPNTFRHAQFLQRLVQQGGQAGRLADALICYGERHDHLAVRVRQYAEPDEAALHLPDVPYPVLAT